MLNRIVELQAKTVIRQITDTQEEYDFIENLIESHKPPLPKTDHHYLIATPFRYPLPIAPEYAGRFKPPYYERNCFYGTLEYQTSVFEYGYHWLLQRVHLKGLSQQPQPRTHFKVKFKDPDCLDLRKHKRIKEMMDRHDYSSSHHFVLKQKNLTSLIYPSCRDPKQGSCVITFEINTLGKKPTSDKMIHLIYDEKNKKCLVESPLEWESRMEVVWEDVF